MGINRKYIIAGMLATASVMSFSDVQQSHALEFRVTTTRVHFRTGAGINYSSMGVLSKGVKVTYIGESGNWTKVEYNSKTGYICSDYLEKSHTPSTETMYTTPSTPVKGSIDEVLNLANQLLGKPYVWWATGPDSFDCSGFTQYIYKHGANITIPRVSSQQGNFGTTVSRNNLKAGDLVFFDTNGINDGNISHLGIYDGNGNLIHSSFSVKKIVKVPLNTSYWNSTFVTAKRIL